MYVSFRVPLASDTPHRQADEGDRFRRIGPSPLQPARRGLRHGRDVRRRRLRDGPRGRRRAALARPDRRHAGSDGAALDPHVRCWIRVRQRTWRRPYAVRAPKDWPIARPGDLVEFDLVEFDTLDVRQLSTLVLKQFTAWGRASRAPESPARGVHTSAHDLRPRPPHRSRPDRADREEPPLPAHTGGPPEMRLPHEARRPGPRSRVGTVWNARPPGPPWQAFDRSLGVLLRRANLAA